MAWKVVARGTGFDDLRAQVENMELPKGTRVRAVLNFSLPVGWAGRNAFDLPGAELAFRPFIPQGMSLVDVWGEGKGTGVVEMVADPAWLLAVVAFIKANWVVIVLLGVLLALIITGITLLLWVLAQAAAALTSLLLVGTAILGGLGLLWALKRRR